MNTPRRLSARDRLDEARAEDINNEDRAALVKLVNAKLSGQRRRDAAGFVLYRMRTKTQAENLTKRLESL